MTHWKYLFESHILERGKNYYKAGAVTKVKKDANGDYEAVVVGSEDYQVEINFEQGDLWCECPYAEDGKHCKHMASVLYYLEDNKTIKTTGVKVKKDAFKDLVENLSEAQVKTFLIKLAREDAGIENLILTTFANTINKKQMSALKQQVRAIAKRYGGKHGFIEYRQVSDYSYDITRFMDDYVQTLIDNDHLSEAFELICYIFVMVCEVDLDDSLGTTGAIGHLCYEYFLAVLDDADEQLKKQMFEWFSRERSGNLLDYMRDEFIHEFWVNQFKEQPFASKKLAVLDAEINALTNNSESVENWSVNYRYKKCILERLRIMDDLEMTSEQKLLYRQQFRHLPEIRQMEIAEYLAIGDDKNAIKLLVESKEIDANSAGYASDHSEKLLEIYSRIGMVDSYKTELITYTFEHSRGDIDTIRKLKEICDTDEWLAFREKLLEKFQGDTKYKILNEDQLYKRLFDEICSNTSYHISTLNTYEAVLKPHFSNEMLEIYVDYVVRGAKHTGNRNHYQALISYLKKIATYPSGKEKAEEIVTQWKTAYKNRPSMVDELKKAGF